VFRVWYRLARLIVDLLVLRCRRDRSKDAEILVLRQQLAVLHRQVPCGCRKMRPGRLTCGFACRRDLWVPKTHPGLLSRCFARSARTDRDGLCERRELGQAGDEPARLAEFRETARPVIPS
jgi:hypothetical protein